MDTDNTEDQGQSTDQVDDDEQEQEDEACEQCDTAARETAFLKSVLEHHAPDVKLDDVERLYTADGSPVYRPMQDDTSKKDADTSTEEPKKAAPKRKATAERTKREPKDASERNAKVPFKAFGRNTTSL